MDTRKLQHFVEVATAGSFTKAAERLSIVQPAISKSIQKLEEELQLTLFDRSEKAVILTPEGKILLKHAHFILEKLEEARKDMEALRELDSGEIQIGLPSMFGSAFFPHIIKEFKKKYPSLHISVMEEGTVQIRNLIKRNMVDFGIVSVDPADPEIDIDFLLTEELVACFPAGHPLADRKSVTLQEMLQEPLVLFNEGYFQRKLLEETSRNANIPLNVTFTTNQVALINSLVVEGVGVTLFLRTYAASDKRLKAVSLNPPIFIKLGVGRKKNIYLSKASRACLEFLKQGVDRRS